MLNTDVCRKARLSRDPRFDGKFFTAVKTTGIYCRTICPVSPPKEINVEYYTSAIECANAGFRPCLRCRPDSAPTSQAWKGVNATLDRAIKLIEEGALQSASLTELADRLGISDRYLRKLFKQHLGTSPKSYALYQQCLFAKQLLHQTHLPITEVALASGFSSIRRFNDCFKSQLELTPSSLRKSGHQQGKALSLKLYYRPPFNWAHMQSILKARSIDGLEWCESEQYGRTFNWFGTKGHFSATHDQDNHLFTVEIELDNITHLKQVVNNIKRVLDLDVDMQVIEHDLQQCFIDEFTINSGIRLPGVWNIFEAGIRAVLGQQISVNAARNLVEKLVSELGEQQGNYVYFPTAKAIAASELTFFKIPEARKQTLRNLAQHFVENEPGFESSYGDYVCDPAEWAKLKGIGPWTIEYAQLRGLSDPDIFLAGDLGVKKSIQQLSPYLKAGFSPEQVSPWRSYLTFQLWSHL